MITFYTLRHSWKNLKNINIILLFVFCFCILGIYETSSCCKGVDFNSLFLNLTSTVIGIFISVIANFGQTDHLLPI